MPYMKWVVSTEEICKRYLYTIFNMPPLSGIFYFRLSYQYDAEIIFVESIPYPIMKHIAIVCNPTLQQTKHITSKVISYLTNKGVAHQTYMQDWPLQLEPFTDIWIIGGDGTLHQFINQYKIIAQPICLFKAGTGNDIHWMLYKDVSIEEQIALALSGKFSFVDVGKCNGKLFIGGVGIGFDGAVVYDLLGKKRLAGKASYIPTIIKNLFGYSEKYYTIKVNDTLLQQDCFLISIANIKRYGGEYLVAPNASVTDSKLDINIVGKVHPMKRIKFLSDLAKGQHIALPFVHYEQSDKVLIQAAEPLHAHIDGEYTKADRFDITLTDKKLTFSGVLTENMV